MRQIAERLVAGFQHAYDAPYTQVAYMQDELVHKVKDTPIQLAPFTTNRRFHLYCSPHNPGTLEVAQELQAVCPAITLTTELNDLNQCDHFVARDARSQPLERSDGTLPC